MGVWVSIREVFCRRRVKSLDELADRVVRVNVHQESPRGNFVFPGIDYADRIEVESKPVGCVEYGINPLADRLYINSIEIHPNSRRQGLGLGVLWSLWREHQVPIIPLHEFATSHGFWQCARRRFAAAGAVVGPELRGMVDMDAEQARWAHLVPEPEHERLIREYLASPEGAALAARGLAGGQV